METRQCDRCGTPLKRKRWGKSKENAASWRGRKFCSTPCRWGDNIPRRRRTRPCDHCGVITLNPKYCSKPCYGAANTKPDQPKETKDHRGRQKARRTIPLTECAKCKTTHDLQRHHIDLNPRNNAPTNIAILCRPCHRAIHKGLRRASTLQQGIFTYSH